MNKITGIIVGVVLLGIVGGVVLKKLVFPSADAPTRTTAKDGYMDVIKVDAKITNVLAAEPSGADNAAEHYTKAIELYFAKEGVISDATVAIVKGDAKDHADALKTLEEIRAHIGAGAKQARMNYLVQYGSGKLQVSQRQGNVERLGLTIDVLKILGDYYIKNKRFKDADAMYRDMFIAGWHMIEARSHLHMVAWGVDIQQDALSGMSMSIARDIEKDAANKLRAPMLDYHNALKEFKYKYEEKSKIFSRAHKGRLEAGDVWKIADNDKDRTWRVQALLGMGMIRFTHLSKANTARNNAMIEKFLNSTDPIEKAAAQAAKAYTEIDFNTAGTTW